jgi:hypothetical protein
MHTYIKAEKVWKVGCDTGQRWVPVKEFDEEWKAAWYVSFLNGGAPPEDLLRKIFPDVYY